MQAIHIIGQVVFGGYFLWSGLQHFRNHKMLTGYAASMKLPSPALAVYGSGLLLALGGLSIIFNFYIDFGLLFIIIFLVPASLVFHAFWKMTDMNMKMSNYVNFSKNIALIGAALMLMI